MSYGFGSGVGLPTAGCLVPAITGVGGHFAPPLSTVQLMLTTVSVTPGALGLSTKCGTSRVVEADVFVSVTSYVSSPEGGMRPGLLGTAGGRTIFRRSSLPGVQGVWMPRDWFTKLGPAVALPPSASTNAADTVLVVESAV